MATTYSLRFEIDASAAEAGSKKFVAAINMATKAVEVLDAKADAAFAKLMKTSGDAFAKLSRDINKFNSVKLSSGLTRDIDKINASFSRLSAPNSAVLKSITQFATVLPNLLNNFKVSGNFSAALDKINTSLSNLKVPKSEALQAISNFAKTLPPLLNNFKISGNFADSLNSITTALANFKSPSPTALKNFTTFATTVPALLSGFNVSSNFADSLNKISAALAAFKVPNPAKVETLKAFGVAIQAVAPSLKINGNFGGIVKLGEALGSFRSPSEKAVTNMRAFFNALNSSGSKVSINANMVNGVVNLSNALGMFKAPSATAAANLKAFFAALSLYKPMGSVSSFSQITTALNGFKGPTAAQTKNVRDFVTMLGQIKNPPNAAAIAQSLNMIATAAANAGRHLSGFRSNLGGIGGSFSGLNGGITQTTTNLRGLENAFSGTFQAASVFRTALGAITLGSLSQSIYEANTNFLAFKSTMQAVSSGDMTKTGDEMRYVTDMANRLGQRVTGIQESYGGFAVSASLAGVSQEQTRKIFESTITAMTVLHRSSDRTKLALLALEQMMSKGNVSAEELRRQLGEQMPGSVNLMARALKVSTAELNNMLKAGEVLSADALPKFAEEVMKTYGPALTGSLQNAVSQFNILYNTINDLFILVGQSGVMENLAKAFTQVNAALSTDTFKQFAVDFGERTAVVIAKLGDAFTFLVKNIDSVVAVFKVLLALNIGRFISGFAGMLLGSVANIGAWSSALNNMRAAFLGVIPSATGAATAVGVFGRIAAAASILSGPIGMVIFALGALGTAWLTSGTQGEEFKMTLDDSKESMDRYRESLQVMTQSQMGLALIEQKNRMEELRVKTQETVLEFKNLLNNAPSGKRWTEVQNLVTDIKALGERIDTTSEQYKKFVSQLSAKQFDTKQADQLRIAFLKAQAAIDLYGRESEIAKQKTAELNAVMNGMSSSGAVAAMNSVTAAASNMAGVVSSAAAQVANAFAQMRMSQAQIGMADKFADLEVARNKDIANVDDVVKQGNLSFQDRKELLVDVSKTYQNGRAELNKYATALEGANKQLDLQKTARTYFDKYSDGLSEAEKKAKNLKETIATIEKDMWSSPTEKQNTIAGVTKEYDDWVKAEAKRNSRGGGGGGGGKGKGGGGGAAGNLDTAGKSTLAYNKELAALDSALKKNNITQEQYNTGLTNLNQKYKDVISSGFAFKTSFEELREELSPASTAVDEFVAKQKLITDALNNGTIKIEEYIDLMGKLKKANSDAAAEAAGGGGVFKGINKGLLDLTKTSEDFTNDIAGVVTNAFGGLEDALTEFVTTGKLDFKSLADSIISDIMRMVIRYTVIQPIIKALSGALGGAAGATPDQASGGGLLGTFIKSIFGGGLGASAPTGTIPIPTPKPFAKGGAFNNGKIVPFAKGGLTNNKKGGIVNSPTYFEMAGKKTGLMGEAGSEGILPLTRVAGKLGVHASMPAQAATTNVSVRPQVNVNVATPAGYTGNVRTNTDSKGNVDLEVIVAQIENKIANNVSKGGGNVNRAMETRYGVDPAAGNVR